MTFNLIHGGQELFKKMRELTKQKPKILYHEEENKYQIWAEPDYMLFEDQGIAVVRAIKTKFDKKKEEFTPASALYIFFDTKKDKEIFRGKENEGFTKSAEDFFREKNMSAELTSREGINCFYNLDNGDFLCGRILKTDKRILCYVDLEKD